MFPGLQHNFQSELDLRSAIHAPPMENSPDPVTDATQQGTRHKSATSPEAGILPEA